MAVFRVIDDDIVTEAEFRARRNELADFLTLRAAGRARESFALSAGRMLSIAAPEAPPGTPQPAPIGKGLPLSILIREVYTGEHPKSGLFGEGGDIAVVSGVKNYEMFNASTRALNFLVKDAKAYSRIRRPSPFTDGSSLVAYSPAVMTDSLTIGFELAVASFPQELMDSLSRAFNTLAGIPLLLPYSGYLLGAGEVFKLVGDAGHALFDGIKFSVTDSIDFDLMGTSPAAAGFRIMAASDDLAGYKYTDAAGAVDANGNRYSGDAPYIVISLDGKPRDNLKTFAPTVASAAVMQRFFAIKDGAQAGIDEIVEGLQFVSDFKYREKAMALQKELAEPGLDGATKKDIQSQLDAALKNIVTDALKPKTTS
jgi:hypothetical protein